MLQIRGRKPYLLLEGCLVAQTTKQHYTPFQIPFRYVCTNQKTQTMQTTLITKDKNGNTTKLSMITQQYETGLYLAVYKGSRCISQGSKNLFAPDGDKKYHKKLRRQIIRNNDELVVEESSVFE